jgi:hypothetical protein
MPSRSGLRQRGPQARLAGPGEFMIIPRSGGRCQARAPELPSGRAPSRLLASKRRIGAPAGTHSPSRSRPVSNHPLPGDAGAGPPRPAGSTVPGSGQTERDRCMALLLRRRTRAELERLLAERLAASDGSRNTSFVILTPVPRASATTRRSSSAMGTPRRSAAGCVCGLARAIRPTPSAGGTGPRAGWAPALPSPPGGQAGWHPGTAVGFARGQVTGRSGSSARQRSDPVCAAVGSPAVISSGAQIRTL